MVHMDAFARRLKKARAHAGLSQADLARVLGVKPQAIQYLEQESNNARGSKHTSAIARACAVDAMWLSTGRGTMLLEKKQMAAQDQAAYNALPPEAYQVARAWMKLSPANQEVFRQMVFVHAAIDQRYPWLRRGRPSTETYDQFEKRVEQNLAALINLAAERERR
jgi:DNA-binding XRE family transcriptional regulator